MTHLDRDHLVLLALDDQEPGTADTEHLGGCATCREELESLQAVAGLGRETRAETELPPVAAAVWERIAAETGHLPHDAQDKTAPPRVDAARGSVSRRRFRSAARYGVVAAAAATVAAVVTVALTPGSPDESRVVAQAQLNRQAAAPAGAAGRARIVDSGSGTLRLELELTGMPAPAGLYEIWLYDGKTTMIPLGVTAGTYADVPIPRGVTVQAFPVVDVSAQRIGQQEHGTSMVQGTISAGGS
ncbi:anti-sigma factor [Amycolatopsis sp. NPDC049159]|uniref:anti-sigma factor domain-containing protein n=1 Tax=unclassified Amycolatopsis TaxID=2618356 RepID=UPI0033FB362E